MATDKQGPYIRFTEAWDAVPLGGHAATPHVVPGLSPPPQAWLQPREAGPGASRPHQRLQACDTGKRLIAADDTCGGGHQPGAGLLRRDPPESEFSVRRHGAVAAGRTGASE